VVTLKTIYKLYKKKKKNFFFFYIKFQTTTIKKEKKEKKKFRIQITKYINQTLINIL